MGELREIFDTHREYLRQEREEKEVSRMKYAIAKLNKLAKAVGVNPGMIKINLEGNRQIDFWVYTGWFCGRRPIGHIKGRGIENLMKEINKCQTVHQN